MARPPTSRIMPGSPLPLRAEPWNNLVDSYQTVVSNAEQQSVSTLKYEYLQNAIRVKNDGTPRQVGEYLVVDDIVTDPQEIGAEGTFRINPALIGRASRWSDGSLHWGRILILARDLMPNEIGYAYYTGTAIARLKKRYDYHDHCDIDPNDTNVLVSHPSGSWQILWDNCVVDPNVPEEGWSVLRHRGIWDRTLFGVSENNIAPPSNGDTSGTINVEYNGVDTGEVVTAYYTWREGPTIFAGDGVEIKWRSDERRWTINKLGGSPPASQSSVFGINDTNMQGDAIPLVLGLEDVAEPENSPDITLDVPNNRIILHKAGSYRISYNVTVTPIDISDYPGYEEANGVAAFYRYFRFFVGKANEIASQEEHCFYFVDSELEWDPAQPWLFKTSPFSLSGTALMWTTVDNEFVTIDYTTDYGLQQKVGEATGGVSVTRLATR